MKYFMCFLLAGLQCIGSISRAQLSDDSLLSICRKVNYPSGDSRYNYVVRSTTECFQNYFHTIKVFKVSYNAVERMGNQDYMIETHNDIHSYISLNKYSGEQIPFVPLDSFNIEITQDIHQLYLSYLYLLVNGKLNGCYIPPSSYSLESRNEGIEQTLGDSFNNCWSPTFKDDRVEPYIDRSSSGSIYIAEIYHGLTTVYHFTFGKKHRISSCSVMERF